MLPDLFGKETASGLSVLLVTPSYPPVLGGSEIEAQRVCKMLRQRGYHMEVACGGGDPMPRQSEWTDPEGTPVYLFGHTPNKRLRAWSLAAGVARLLLSKRYDLVYLLMTGVHLAATLPLARMLNIPIVMKFSGSNTIRPLATSALGRLELRMLRRWADRILVLNQAMEVEAVEAGLPEERLGRMPNPVDTNSFRPLDPANRMALRRQMGRQEQEQMILYVGRLAPEKRLDSLLRAFEQVASSNQNARLVLVGDGPLRGALEAQAQAGQHADWITFAGAQSIHLVQNWMQIGNIFALVSEVEGLPCSLIEAMSVGMTAVVSDIPANTQLISDGERGRLAAVGNSEEIGRKLAECLADPAWSLEAGAACREFVLTRFSSAIVADHYEMLFSELSTRRHLCGR